MNTYLDRLKIVLAENSVSSVTDKTDRSPFVGFVSSPDSPFSETDTSDADLSEQRLNQHSRQAGCCVCGQPARFGFGVRLRLGQEGRWFCAAHRPTDFGSA
jgi:hypothetical protein